MTWRLEVRHRSGYQYDGPVAASYNEARMTPVTDLHQTTISATLSTEPRSSVQRYWDYWGTQVAAFDIHEPHERLTITSTAIVETEPVPPMPAGVAWSVLHDDQVRDDFAELLGPSRYVPRHDELDETARELEDDRSPVDTVLAICGWAHGSMRYQPGVTGVHSDALDAWQSGSGVCQDFAHVALLLLRSLGIPARYVSGYLHPIRDAGVGSRTKGESHAWIEAWTGDWWGYDPTNDVGIDERHVIVARGRDYSDVPPLRGIYAGVASSGLGVEVEVTRLR